MERRRQAVASQNSKGPSDGGQSSPGHYDRSLHPLSSADWISSEEMESQAGPSTYSSSLSQALQMPPPRSARNKSGSKTGSPQAQSHKGTSNPTKIFQHQQAVGAEPANQFNLSLSGHEAFAARTSSESAFLAISPTTKSPHSLAESEQPQWDPSFLSDFTSPNSSSMPDLALPVTEAIVNSQGRHPFVIRNSSQSSSQASTASDPPGVSYPIGGKFSINTPSPAPSRASLSRAGMSLLTPDRLSFTGFRDRSFSDLTTLSETDRDLALSEPISPVSEVSLSPTSLATPFPPGMSDSNFLRSVFEQHTPSTPRQRILMEERETGSDPYLQNSTVSQTPDNALTRHSSFAGLATSPDATIQAIFQPISPDDVRVVSSSSSAPSLRQENPSRARITSDYMQERVLRSAGPSSSGRSRFASAVVAPHQRNASSDDVPGRSNPPKYQELLQCLQSPVRLTSAGESSRGAFRPAEDSEIVMHEWRIPIARAQVDQASAFDAASASTRSAGIGLELNQSKPSRDEEMSEELEDQVDVNMRAEDQEGSGASIMQRGESSGTSGSYGQDSSASYQGQRSGWSLAETYNSIVGGDSSFISTHSSSFESSFQDDSLLSLPMGSRYPWQMSQDTPLSSPAPSIKLTLDPGGVSVGSGFSGSLPREQRDGVESGVGEFGQLALLNLSREDRSSTWPRPWHNSVSGAATDARLSTPDAGLYQESISGSTSRLLSPADPGLRSRGPNAMVRASSSASSSSRSSSNAVLDFGTTAPLGPPRSRATVVAASRPLSARGSAEKSTFAAPERRPSTASALRRARGLSHGSVPSSFQRTIEMSRSVDSVDALKLGDSKRRLSIDEVPTSGPSSSASLIARGSSKEMMAPLRNSRSVDIEGSSGRPRSGKVGFNEVSRALETLRLFLHQKDRTKLRSSTSGDAILTRTESQMLSSDDRQASEPSDHAAEYPKSRPRTLRHPAKVPLPPRGSVRTSFPEFNTLTGPGDSTPSTSSDRVEGHSRSHSSILSPSSSREEDRLAVLQDLSERVTKLKEESDRISKSHQNLEQLTQDTHDAILDPGREETSPAHGDLVNLPQGHPWSRRELHEEYLRQRKS
ncbi:hypothetical protein IE53DRAFT_367997 [Violaceomyces palustris]|uniref:Uncharacterized protein n=1 Tax=Violaceomyces palustris TaxID=1673888 RepID=A0ACD0P0G3_9BASI|nr:hypothetical protein IE53DRAFT_367997 [Violaceomyces palustris]